MKEVYEPFTSGTVRRDSPRYSLLLEHVESHRSIGPEEHDLFGARLIRLMDLGAPDRTLTSEKNLLRKKLGDLVKNPKIKEEVLSYIHGAGLVRILFPGFTNADLSQIPDVENVSDENIVDFIIEHHKVHQERSLGLREKVPTLKQNFLDRIEKAIKNGRLPRMSLTRLKKIVTNARVVPLDILSGYRFELAGSADVSDDSVRIGMTELVNGQLESTFTHELLHILSGRTLIFKKNEMGSEFDRLFSSHSGLSNSASGKWMNEALTEHLTTMLLSNVNNPFDSDSVLNQIQKEQNENKRGGYFYERALLGWVMKLGSINPERMLRAYFEDYNPEAKKGYRARKRKTFYYELTKKFGKGFLKRLDVLIDKHGIVKIARVLRNEGILHLHIFGQLPSIQDIEKALV